MIRLKKRGFTVIELIAVLTILAIILAITLPTIQNVVKSSKQKACVIDTKMMVKAAKNYVSIEGINITLNDTLTIPLTNLYSKRYLTVVYDPEDQKTACEGYVNVTNNNGSYKYDAFLKCGTTCESIGYNDDLEINKLIEAVTLTPKNGANYFIGPNPNNWVKFGRLDQSNTSGIMWRIVRSDNDGLKLIYEGRENGNLPPLENGRVLINNTTGVAWDKNGSNKWDQSTLKNQLNDWFNSMYIINRSKYVNPINFEIGGIPYNDPTLLSTFIDYKSINSTNIGGSFIGHSISKTSVGLISPSDFISTSSNDTCMGSYRENGSGIECAFNTDSSLNNFLYKSKYHWWTMNGRSDTDTKAWSVSNAGQIASSLTTSPVLSVRPVINLDRDVVYYTGIGTLDDPYIIEDYMVGIADKPVITLNGSNPYVIKEGDDYLEEGATALDEQDGDISSLIATTSNINTLIPGTYSVIYSVIDSDNNVTEVTRIINVVQRETPVINLNGSNPMYVTLNHAYVEPRARVIDIDEGDISDDVVITGSVDTSELGVYEVKYNITNSRGKSALEVIRRVIVEAPKPVITLNGEDRILVGIGSSYTELGATALDEVDGDITNSIATFLYKNNQRVSSINTNVLGSYVIKYTVTNSLGSSTTKYRYVDIVPVSGPKITFTPTSNYTSKKQHEVKVSVDQTNYPVVDSSLKYLWVTSDTYINDFEEDIKYTFKSGDTIKGPTGTKYYYLYVIAKDTYGNTTINKNGAFKTDNYYPEIDINGSSVINLVVGGTYTDQGATADDYKYDGNITSKITKTSDLNTNVVGIYHITYTVSDSAGNTTSASRRINVNNPIPRVSLNGNSEIRVRIDTSYTELGATATDSIDGDLTSKIVKTGSVDITKAGTYTITYSVTNSYGVTSSRERKVIVYLPEPQITILGSNPYDMLVGDIYSDAGSTATDEVDGDITNKIITSGTVNPSVAGTYYITYSVTNSYGVTKSVKRRVDVNNPSINILLNGSNPYTMFVKGTYTELGATATDQIDGDITSKIIITSNINPNIAGTYTVTYSVTDSVGVTKVETRTVIVKNPTINITINGNNPYTMYVGEVYTESGATASDEKDGDISSNIRITSNLNPNVVGSYIVTYSVTDSVGVSKTKTRTINVIDLPGPIIALLSNGNATYKQEHSLTITVTESKKPVDETSLKYVWTTSINKPADSAYVNTFYNDSVIKTPTSVTGKYYLHVVAKDIDSNTSPFSSNAFYVDNTSPAITLNGPKVYQVPVDGVYQEPGATAVDNDSGVNSDGVTSTSNVVPGVLGTYTVTYMATDKAGNSTSATRTVSVIQIPLVNGGNTTPKYYADYFIGSNPDNWIMFGEVSSFDDRPLLWRVVKSDENGIKIVYEGIKQNDNTLPSENGRLYLENTYTHAYDTGNSNNFDDASLYSKLQTWYTNLYEPDKNALVKPINWCIGLISSPYTVDDFKNNECVVRTTTQTSIGLLNSADYMLTTSSGCTGYDSSACASNNYLAKNYDYWTINGDSSSANVFNVKANSGLILKGANTLNVVRPVINLKNDLLILSGDGTLAYPYKLNTRVQIIDTEKPVITFNPNTGTTTDSSFGVLITATDNITGIFPGSLKYVWTTSSTAPNEDQIINNFVNGDKVSIPSTTGGTYYLWAMARDNKNNLTIQGSGAFKFDNTAPVITINGINPYGLELGNSYTDAGATALDDVDGNITVLVTSNVNPNVEGTYTVTYTATDSVGNKTTATRTVKVVAPLMGDSIIAAVRNSNHPTGDYTMNVNGEIYNVELINIAGDTTYSLADGATVNLGNNTVDQRMLIVKYNGNLTIESGVTVTSTTRKKGMLIYATGTMNNDGTISMSARGASAAGQNVYLWKNTDGSYEYIPTVGASGAASTTSPSNAQRVAGKTGLSGSGRVTGGGGSGGAYNNISGNSVSGAGGAGTSYSGGSGGGATASREVGTYTGYAGSSTGGPGGNGRSTKYSDSNGYNVGGGAGNPGGAGSGTSCCSHLPGESGTGGLLIIYANSINNNGTISSNGVSGGYGVGASGGSSGGGSINLFASTNYLNTGNIEALGGAAQYYGGAGGNGTITSGYIYNNDFIPILPEIDFDIISGTTYKPSYGVKVNVSSPKIGIKAGTQKYVWTTSAIAPTEDLITNAFTNGTTINTPVGVSGSYYLWVTVRDNKDALNIEGAGPFNVDDIDPVITVTGTNPAIMYTGEVYNDAGATATDNRDGAITVSTTSDLNPMVIGTYTVTYTATDSAGNIVTVTRAVNVLASLMEDSLLAVISKSDLPDGDQKIVINGVTYDAEIINIYGDTTYSTTGGATVSLGNVTSDQRMLIVKYNGNLTIDTGVTVTTTARKRGMLIYVTGTLTNNGTISMSARGAIATGQNVYLWKNADGSYEYVPATGGTGAVAVTGEVNGVVGGNGTGRATGGGGGGASMRAATKGGTGAAGTSYSGGSGGGGASSALDSPVTGRSAVGNGGAGGAAVGRRTSATMYVSSGGAGNPSGNDARPTAGANVTVTGNAASSAAQGTGGLLIIYANNLDNVGTIESRGSASNFPAGYNTSVAASGGSSGGGSVNIFYNTINNIGTITAQGGQSGACAKKGGNGGDGSVTIGYISDNTFVSQ